MTECWLCERAMVTDTPWLPWPICDRANCKHEKDLLLWRMARESTRSEYEQIARYQ